MTECGCETAHIWGILCGFTEINFNAQASSCTIASVYNCNVRDIEVTCHCGCTRKKASFKMVLLISDVFI